MPVVAFAFGSFGDIVSTAQLLVKVISLLRKGRRSSRCDETEKELKALGTDLANLTFIRFHEAMYLTPLAQSVAARIQEEVRRCHLIILRFFEKIKASNGLLHKVLWAASEERELSNFFKVVRAGTLLEMVVQDLDAGRNPRQGQRVDDVQHLRYVGGLDTSHPRSLVSQTTKEEGGVYLDGRSRVFKPLKRTATSVSVDAGRTRYKSSSIFVENAASRRRMFRLATQSRPTLGPDHHPHFF
ncbi:hypothetical protein C8R47DRAFT_523253 [Mycena vitilis]|nr:hypothetical protein C8R47DRAFT_523253 [Mycena vitilis]